MLRKLRRNEIEPFYTERYFPYVRELSQYGRTDEMQVFVMEKRAASGEIGIYIYSDDEAKKGFVIAERKGDLLRPRIHLQSFCVDKDVRRRGIGTYIFGEFLDMTDAPLYATVLPKNRPAVGFWRKMIAVYGLQPVTPEQDLDDSMAREQIFCARKPCRAEGDDRLLWPVDMLGLANRTRYGLLRNGIYTVGDVLNVSADDLIEIRNFGRTSMDDLREALDDIGESPNW